MLPGRDGVDIYLQDERFRVHCAMSAISQVIERTSRQINQLRKGLKETGIWPLLIHRRDVIPILFPRDSEAQVTPQVRQQRHI